MEEEKKTCEGFQQSFSQQLTMNVLVLCMAYCISKYYKAEIEGRYRMMWIRCSEYSEIKKIQIEGKNMIFLKSNN